MYRSDQLSPRPGLARRHSRLRGGALRAHAGEDERATKRMDALSAVALAADDLRGACALQLAKVRVEGLAPAEIDAEGACTTPPPYLGDVS